MKLQCLQIGVCVLVWSTACDDGAADESAAVNGSGARDAAPATPRVERDAAQTEAGAIEGPAVDVGRFSVQLEPPRAATALRPMASKGRTTILGTVGDKRVAEPIVWEVQREQDGCRLLVPRVPFCATPCGSQVCVEDDTCESDRRSQDVGTVAVRGIVTDDGADEVVLTSVRNTYQNGVTTLPYPAFAEGDAITLDATGEGAIPAFEISVRGTATLEVPADREYVVARGQDLALTWTPPGRADVSRVEVALDISHHGGTKGKLECDVEDSGAFTLPGALLDELLALGVAGFPSILITRSASQAVQLPMGRVRLRIYEYAERFVTIPGLVSCTAAEQCPGGQTCRDDKTCG